jgi:hypothetical protein
MQAEPTATPIRISTNTIIDGKFYLRGEPLPFSRAEDLPDNLKPLVVTEPEAEEENEPCGAFELNTAYTLTSDGQLGRALRRQVAQMEAENAEEAWLNQANAAELPPRSQRPWKTPTNQMSRGKPRNLLPPRAGPMTSPTPPLRLQNRRRFM